MNKVLYFLVILFLLSSCSEQEDDYCLMVDEINNSFLKEFALPRGAILSGSGGAMMNDVEKLSLSFHFFQPLDVEKARTLYVDMMEEFVSRVNNNKEIRPYLHTFPFGIENICISISFKDENRDRICDGNVALMFVVRNEIFYEAFDPDTQKFYSLHREPYTEARKLVISSKTQP